MNVLITAKAATGDSKVTYTISSENNITAFASAKEAKSAPDVERFATAKELAKLAEQWPAARLVDIWNALPGVVPAIGEGQRASTRLCIASHALPTSNDSQPPPPPPPAAKQVTPLQPTTRPST